MLTGKEKIKDIDEKDICNYIGDYLNLLGLTQVKISEEGFPKEKVIHVKYSDDFNTKMKISGTSGNRSIENLAEFLKMTRIRKIWGINGN